MLSFFVIFVSIQKKIQKKEAKVGDDKLDLINIFGSNSMVGPLLGFNRTWVKTLTRNSSKGWFRGALLFISKPVLHGGRESKNIVFEEKDITINLLSLKQIKALVQKLQLDPIYTTGKLVHVTNTLTQETIIYGSKKEAARAMNADESTFRNNRDNLFTSAPTQDLYWGRRTYLFYLRRWL